MSKQFLSAGLFLLVCGSVAARPAAAREINPGSPKSFHCDVDEGTHIVEDFHWDVTLGGKMPGDAPSDAVGVVKDSDAAGPVFLGTDAVRSDIQGPAGTTTYYVNGWGDGDTVSYYMAIPDSIQTARAGERLAVQVIIQDDDSITAQNKLGIGRTDPKTIRCVVK